MKEFLIYIIKSGICLSMFLLIYQLFLRRATFFRFNRAYLLFGLVASFIIPAFPYTYNVYSSMNLPLSSMPNTDTIVTEPSIFYINIWFILGIIYTIGVIVVLFHNIQLFRMFLKLTKSNKKVSNNQYTLIDSTSVESPFSIINYIFINTQQLSVIEKDLILKHEIMHITQKHWVDLLCSEVLLLSQWFNPIAWKYVKAQKENHEFLADKAVIDAGISPTLYRAVLINQQFKGSAFSFSSSFNLSKPLNRLTMITKTKSSPWKKIAILTILPLLFLFIWVSAKPNNVSEQSKNETMDSVKKVKSGAILSMIGSHKDEYKAAYKDAQIDECPLILIDNKIATLDEMKKLDSDDIKSMNVLKGENATKVYGDKAKYGAISITTNTSSKEVSEKTQIDDRTFIMINNKIATLDEMEELDSSKIESMDVLKGESATKTYGDKAKYGAISIITKKK